MHHFGKYLACLATLAALAACGKITQQVGAQDQAVDDLNRLDYADAIAILEPLHAQNPADGELSLLLASAYTGSIGFNVVDSFPAFKPLLNNGLAGGNAIGLVDGGTPAPVPTAASGDGQLPKLETEAVKFLNQLTTNFTLLAAIPYTAIDDRRMLVQALLLLANIDKDDPQYVSGQTYAAVINALQFLNLTRDGMTGILGKSQITFLDTVCALEPQTFLQNLDPATQYLLSSVQALNISYTAHGRTPPSSLDLLKNAAVDVQQDYAQTHDQLDASELAFSATKASFCN